MTDKQDRPYDPKANDVWSTGILMMKALGLGHPYLDGTDGDSDLGRMRIAAGTPRWRWTKEDRIPGGRGEVIMGMLEHNPSKRWTVSYRYDARADGRSPASSSTLTLPTQGLTSRR